MKNLMFVFALVLLATLSSCQLVGDIFQAGVGVGVFIVLFILFLIIFIFIKISGKK